MASIWPTSAFFVIFAHIMHEGMSTFAKIYRKIIYLAQKGEYPRALHQLEMGDETAQAQTLFVGGLPNDATIEEVKGYFQQYGEVDVDIKVDQETGRSRGFGFLAFQVRSGLK